MTESPSWLETPDDLMLDILQRLGTVEILKSARRVCTTWRQICNDPAMWKVIHVRKPFTVSDTSYYQYETLTKQAVDLSRGELIDISILCFGSDDLLDYIVLRSKKLKRLFLYGCSYITGSGLRRAVKRVPQLEELCISATQLRSNGKDIEAIGQNCPQLKYFMLNKRFPRNLCDDDNDGDALAIANNMPELRRLKLIDRGMTRDGLQAIRDGCPHLEYLEAHRYFKVGIHHGNWEVKKAVKGTVERIKDFKR